MTKLAPTKFMWGYTSGTYKKSTGVSAYVGGSWKPAKSVRRYTGGVWVPVLETTITIALVGNQLVATAGIPSLVQTYQWWYRIGAAGAWTIYPGATGTTVTPSTAVPTATDWGVVAIQYDGTEMESNIVTVYVPPTSTVSMTAPQYCMATISPNTTNNIIVNPTFNISIGTPASVKKVSLQVKHSSASVYTESQVWTTGIAASMSTAAVQFSVDGLWSIQTVITLTDNTTRTSNMTQMTCVKRTISVTASNYAPVAGTSSTLSAAMSSAAPAGFPNSPYGWEYDSGAGWVTWNKTNPQVWSVGDWPPHKFRWSELFPDGSKIYSNTMTVDPVPAPETVIKGYGGNEAQLQALLDRGYNEGKPVELSGGWSINTRVYIPPNARVTATGATFSSTTASQMFSNAGNGNAHNTTTGAAGWQKGGGWIWDGGNFDAYNNSSTAFSLVHCPSFTIQNVRIWNTLAHAIEINSCGGLPNSKGVTAMADSEFTVKILNCVFDGVDAARRTSDYDEAVHIDYAWTSTSQAASTAGSGNDGTVCNNILVSGCTFRRSGRNYSYSVGVGQHHSITDTEGGRALPDAQHKNIKITSNTFMDIHPVNAGNQRGAVHLHSGSVLVYIVANNFVRCAIPISMEPRSHPSGIAAWGSSSGYWIHSNTFNACTAGNATKQINGAAGGTGGAQWYNVSVNNNTFTGNLGGQTTYLISFPDTTTFSIVNNKFWGLTGGGGSPALHAKDGNRIHGSPTNLASGSSGMTLSGNTWSDRADGVGAVSDNS